MKKIKRILITGLVFFSLFACDDALEIVQEGEIDDAASFKTVANLKSFLIADVYSRVQNESLIEFTSIYTDEVGLGIDNFGQGTQLHRYVLDANNGYASAIWLNKNQLINRVNRLLVNEALVEVSTPADIAAKASILAEARALRAHAYLDLISVFSVNPADPNALGAQLYDFVPTIEDKLPRATNGEIYALMETDLAFAEANLSATALDYKYVTPNFINALRARMYLYRKNYVLAKQYATQALASQGLAAAAQYNAMWTDLQQGEAIFSAARPAAAGGIAGAWYFNVTNLTGGCFHDMGRNLFNLYDANPSDVRRINWVDATSIFDPAYLTNPNFQSTDVICINKYPGKLTGAPLRNDIKIFRASEMALILAECEVGGPTPNLMQAAAYVQQVRVARNTGEVLPVYTTPQQAWADIMLERRKELAFEGHRYIDVKRLAPLAGLTQGFDRNPRDDAFSSTPLSLPLTDRGFTLPIPQNEVAGNVTIQQNPGY